MGTGTKLIFDKMQQLHSGLLRFSSGRQKLSMLVNVVDSSDAVVQFSIDEKKYPGKLVNKPASLSQVTPKGYLHISGTISIAEQNNRSVLNMNVSRAHWFEMKKKNNRQWLEQTFFYR
ncbi:MAG TPA: hypothetical protein VF476_11820 [Chitinophagaceae bacterium]